MLEWYQAYSDFNDLMDLTQDLITTLVDKVCGTRRIVHRDRLIDFDEWRRMTMREAVLEYWPAEATRPTPEGLMERERSKPPPPRSAWTSIRS